MLAYDTRAGVIESVAGACDQKVMAFSARMVTKRPPMVSAMIRAALRSFSREFMTGFRSVLLVAGPGGRANVWEGACAAL
jgi:hypothetical protein